MSYLTQIPIAEAREWLRLDDNSNDSLIELMIKNACKVFEQRTRHFIFQQSKDYKKGKRIYDFPIADTTNLTNKTLYYIADEDVTLDVGYASGELPEDIKECIFTMVETKFYANESEKVSSYPPLVEETINVYKRFFI